LQSILKLLFNFLFKIIPTPVKEVGTFYLWFSTLGY